MPASNNKSVLTVESVSNPKATAVVLINSNNTGSTNGSERIDIKVPELPPVTAKADIIVYTMDIPAIPNKDAVKNKALSRTG